MKYISKYTELKLVSKGTYYKEIDGQRIVCQGSSIRFQDGVFETDDAEEIKFLENHPNFGSVFIKIDGDIKKARKEQSKTLEEKNVEKEEEEAAEVKKTKVLKVGVEVVKNKKKEEKPAF